MIWPYALIFFQVLLVEPEKLCANSKNGLEHPMKYTEINYPSVYFDRMCFLDINPSRRNRIYVQGFPLYVHFALTLEDCTLRPASTVKLKILKA